ncbi:MAG: hypothetical protein R2692_03385 [Microbacterium sp.]
MILLGCVIAAVILLLLVLVVEALRSFPVLGVHLRRTVHMGFRDQMFRPVLLIGGGGSTVDASTVGLAGLSQRDPLGGGMSRVAGAYPCWHVAVAVFVITSTKPVNAILGRYSKRVLLWTLGGLYVAAIAGFAFMLVYIDGPTRRPASSRTSAAPGRPWRTSRSSIS